MSVKSFTSMKTSNFEAFFGNGDYPETLSFNDFRNVLYCLGFTNQLLSVNEINNDGNLMYLWELLSFEEDDGDSNSFKDSIVPGEK